MNMSPATNILRRIITFPLYPAVGAIVLPLTIYENNADLFESMADLVRPIGFCVVAAVLLTLVLSLAYRNQNRGGFLATLLVLVVMFGRAIALRVADQILPWFEENEAVLILLASMVVCAVTLAVVFRFTAVLTKAANAAAVAVVAYHAIVLAQIAVEGKSVDAYKLPASEALVANAQGSLPDIYHVVLDGYGREDTLRKLYNFDNSYFVGQLEELGFTVADQAVTPYNQTLLVMASIFRAEYLTGATDKSDISAKAYRTWLSKDLQKNRVIMALRNVGYRLYSVDPEYPPVKLALSDRILSSIQTPLTFFEQTVYKRTSIYPVISFLSLAPKSGDYTAAVIREGFNAAFTEELESPFFLYTHVLAPHPPFDVTGDGQPRNSIDSEHRLSDANHLHKGKPELQNEYRKGYTEKLQFINREAADYLKRVILEMPDPKVIIVHGDHGGGLYFNHDDLTASCLMERFFPLFAIYASDGSFQKDIPENINLINIYRIIFNKYFNSGLPLLPNKSFFVKSEDPENFILLQPAQLNVDCGS